jgi:beta-glucosidase
MIEFPKEFLWGAATSAYQVEGNNMFSDWWEWEKRVGLPDLSGLACRHYELYAQDFDLAKSLNHNCHRLSIEWARVEPEEGRFSLPELEHYRRVILALKERGITPVVTLHHFTNPVWFAKIGAWRSRKADKYFLRYVEQVVSFLANEVPFWATINEPNVYAYHSYLLGLWPPQDKSLFSARQVMRSMAKVHIKAYHLIRSIYAQNHLTYPKISIAQNMQAFVPCPPNLINKFATGLKHKFYNLDFIEKIITQQAVDYIGINYYSPSWVGRGKRPLLRKNSLGWDIYPEGFYSLLKGLKVYDLPVFILENGICTDNDVLRWDYIREHLESLGRAMQEGVKVLGYLYWSLLDNFEWDKGFGPRFGLIEVNYHTYQRTIRESGRKFAEVCLANKL